MSYMRVYFEWKKVKEHSCPFISDVIQCDQDWDDACSPFREIIQVCQRPFRLKYLKKKKRLNTANCMYTKNYKKP